MSRRSSRATGASGTKVLVSFAVGVLVGAALVFPVLPSTLEALLAGATLGSVATVIVVGVVGLAAVMLGLMTLVRLS